MTKGGASELMQVGDICFINIDLIQAAQVYAALIGRKLDQTRAIPRPTLAINFRNQTPLTKDQCVYALETLFHWQGVKVEPAGDGLAGVIPIRN